MIFVENKGRWLDSLTMSEDRSEAVATSPMPDAVDDGSTRQQSSVPPASNGLVEDGIPGWIPSETPVTPQELQDIQELSAEPVIDGGLHTDRRGLNRVGANREFNWGGDELSINRGGAAPNINRGLDPTGIDRGTSPRRDIPGIATTTPDAGLSTVQGSVFADEINAAPSVAPLPPPPTFMDTGLPGSHAAAGSDLTDLPPPPPPPPPAPPEFVDSDVPGSDLAGTPTWLAAANAADGVAPPETTLVPGWSQDPPIEPAAESDVPLREVPATPAVSAPDVPAVLAPGVPSLEGAAMSDVPSQDVPGVPSLEGAAMSDVPSRDVPGAADNIPTSGLPSGTPVDPHNFAAVAPLLPAATQKRVKSALVAAATYLEPDEQVQSMVAGEYLAHDGMAIVTQRRVLFGNGRTFAPEVHAVLLSDVTDVKGWAAGGRATVQVSTDQAVMVLGDIAEIKLAQAFAVAVRAKI